MNKQDTTSDSSMEDVFKKIASDCTDNGTMLDETELKEKFLKAVAKKPPLLKMMVTIIDLEKEPKLTKLFNRIHIHLLFQCRGEGTASSELMDILGLGSTAKAIFIAIGPEDTMRQHMNTITKEFGLLARGNGIAFMLPLSGAASPLFKLVDQETREKIQKQMEREVQKMKLETTHELILSVINPGYSEDVMEAAKSAGATGGTVLHTRQVGNTSSIKAWGISIQGEREIVAILTARENKVAIMKAINCRFGIKSEAEGMVISLPIDSVAGLES